MVIIKAEFLPKKEEIHNEMSLLLEWVSLSNKVIIDKILIQKVDHTLI